MADKFMMALVHTIIGMGTVFLVLIFISLLISLFVYVPVLEKKLKGLSRAGREEKAAAQMKETESGGETPEDEETEETDDMPIDEEELVAVMTAAILAASGETAVSADRLVVRSVRRIGRERRKTRSDRRSIS